MLKLRDDAPDSEYDMIRAQNYGLYLGAEGRAAAIDRIIGLAAQARLRGAKMERALEGVIDVCQEAIAGNLQASHFPELVLQMIRSNGLDVGEPHKTLTPKPNEDAPPKEP